MIPDQSADEVSRAVAGQVAYYRARAPEYDEWWFRRGRYDRGPDIRRRWFAEAAEVQAALDAFAPRGRVLELACGTGLWTERLLPHADALTAIDVSPEMIALNAARLGGGGARYVQADLFAWEPDGVYDVVFFSFWLSHVPPGRFDGFWKKVASALAPNGRVFLVDSRREPESTAANHVLSAPDAPTQVRKLNDGRVFDVFKIYYEPQALSHRLAQLGWRIAAQVTERFFLYASGSRA